VVSRDARIRLAFAGLHPERSRALLEDWGSAAAVLSAIGRGAVRVSRTVREGLLPAAECRRRLAAVGSVPVFAGGPGYPEHLGRLPDRPDVLFARGPLPDRPGVAIVGTRRCTRYGREVARAYGRAAAAAGWPVISGLARGIDGEAHRGCLEAGGAGVAVLGSGPDVIYPAEHRGLLGGLLSGGGAVVSEYPPGTRPEPWRFPARNRIIAGLAGVVVVVESGVTGGSLTTARAALDQGGTVMAVPGDIDRETSVGCNLLIRDGAVPVLAPDDFVEAVSLVLGPPAPAGPGGRHSPEDLHRAASLPLSGATLDEAAALWSMDPAGAAAAAARMELAGLLRLEDGLVVPAGR
jgi:DNA processing protein